MDDVYFRETILNQDQGTAIMTCITACNGVFPPQLEKHEELQVLYVQDGTAVFLVGEQRYALKAGMALIIRSGILHSGKPIEAKSCIYTVVLMNYRFLYNEGMDMIRTHYILPIAHGKLQIPMLVTKETASGRNILSLIEEITSYRTQTPPYCELHLRSISYQLLYSLIECDGPGQPAAEETVTQRIERAVSWMHANPLTDISVEELAQMVHMGRESFYRYFKKEMGCTPVAYKNKLKIEQAAALLTHSTLSVKVIADQTGFSSANYLIRVFVKEMGVTPAQYRKGITKPV